MKKVIVSLFVLMLTACEVSMPGVKSIPQHDHRHTAEELAMAKPFIRNEVTASWSEFHKERSRRGFRSLEKTHGQTFPNGDGTYDIWVVDYLDEESTAGAWEEEYAHVYRLAVLGADPEDEANHEGWAGSTPYEKIMRDRRNAAKYPFR